MKQAARSFSTGLARALSKLGHCSRSAAAKLISEGKVELNGKVERNPNTPVRIGQDRIVVAGKALSQPAHVYMVMNKPRGIVTTVNDERNRETVCSLLPPHVPWLAPVGRLDKASEGLLLFTNDSKWAAKITCPEAHVDKTYHVQVAARADERILDRIREGVADRGEVLRAKKVRILRHGEKNSWLEILLDEGKTRHIRRMLAGCGIEVLRLIRVAIGPLELGSLSKGASRKLTAAEVQKLTKAMA